MSINVLVRRCVKEIIKQLIRRYNVIVIRNVFGHVRVINCCISVDVSL